MPLIASCPLVLMGEPKRLLFDQLPSSCLSEYQTSSQYLPSEGSTGLPMYLRRAVKTSRDPSARIIGLYSGYFELMDSPRLDISTSTVSSTSSMPLRHSLIYF